MRFHVRSKRGLSDSWVLVVFCDSLLLVSNLRPLSAHHLTKVAVDEFADMTFSVANFHYGVGSASPVIDPNGAMYDLNVLTVGKEEIIAQIDYLKNQSVEHGIPVTYLEFGKSCNQGGQALLLSAAESFHSPSPHHSSFDR